MSSSNQGRDQQSREKTLCKYFASNICNKGDQCQFSHDRSAKQDMVCRYYLAGNCFYGDACRFDHVRPEVLQSQRPIAATSVVASTSTANSRVDGHSGNRLGLSSTPSSSNVERVVRRDAPQEKPLISAKKMPLSHVEPPACSAWSKRLDYVAPPPLPLDDFFSMTTELQQVSLMNGEGSDVKRSPML